MAEKHNLAGVAIVDDETGMIRAYELLFKRRNIPVLFFSMSGEDALEKFRKATPRPKVAIIDYRLPGMDGITLMREILAVESETKIIMISGDITIRQKCLDSGAAAFFKKPTSIHEITMTVKDLLSC
jgi:FixJ family two-component response regulator